MFGVQICVALHCERASSLFIAISEVNRSDDTWPFGFKKCEMLKYPILFQLRLEKEIILYDQVKNV